MGERMTLSVRAESAGRKPPRAGCCACGPRARQGRRAAGFDSTGRGKGRALLLIRPIQGRECRNSGPASGTLRTKPRTAHRFLRSNLPSPSAHFSSHARLPITGALVQMGYGDHRDRVAIVPIDNAVREAIDQTTARAVTHRRMRLWKLLDTIQGFSHRLAKPSAQAR